MTETFRYLLSHFSFYSSSTNTLNAFEALHKNALYKFTVVVVVVVGDWWWRRSSHEPSYSTLSPVSTGMGE